MGRRRRGKSIAALISGSALAAVAMMQLPAVAEASDPPRQQQTARAPIRADNTRNFQLDVGDRVFFSEGSAELGSRARRALEAQATWLVRHPTLTITIEGHADDSGSGSYNHEISEQRAEAVRRRLIELGVDQARVRRIGFGRERLIADCADSDCAAQNRRAVTIVGGSLTAASPAPLPVREEGVRRPPRRLF